jgi:hypothetical protein
MVFASAAARTTALASVLAEGMVTYLKDTDVVEIYTGAAWVSLDDPNAIQNSIVDAKGDIITATADNTPSRLAVGANATVLTADSTTATGLKWATPSAGSTFSGARVTKSASQSLTNATYTTITFDQEPLDVGGYHDNATNNSRLTIPTGKTGYFLVQWNLHAYNVTAMAYKLLKNGSAIAQFSDSYNWTTGTEVDFTNQWLGALSAGDYVEIQGYQGTGGSKNVYGGSAPNEPSWFQITYLGA